MNWIANLVKNILHRVSSKIVKKNWGPSAPLFFHGVHPAGA